LVKKFNGKTLQYFNNLMILHILLPLFMKNSKKNMQICHSFFAFFLV